jgi:glycosyltransferase involved in cell wall biosynthesis
MTSKVGGAAGPSAPWLLATGWAAAAERRFGTVEVLSPYGRLEVADMGVLATRGTQAASGYGSSEWMRRIPTVVKTAAKDVLCARDAITLSRKVLEQAAPGPRRFVWQYHHLFHIEGALMARRAQAPLVVHVDAPIVWEAKQWGVRRPLWGGLLERVAEALPLRAADVVCVPSVEVAEALTRVLVAPNVIEVTPAGVDVHHFDPARTGKDEIRSRLGLEGRRVVGWVGTFRRFHGIDRLLRAFQRTRQVLGADDLSLLLVGDGLERRNLEMLAAELHLDNALFVGAVSVDEMPDYIGAMDLCVLSSPSIGGFHYSPMKLREYMAMAKPVAAPAIGDVSRHVRSGVDGLLYDPDEDGALGEALATLLGDGSLRERLGNEARRRTVAEDAWDVRLEQVCHRLGIESRQGSSVPS